MPRGLIRYEHTGSFHFLTFSCYHRFQHLGAAEARDLFEEALERVRRRYRFVVAGYVVMPEHVHLLIGEPVKGVVSGVIHALKLSVAMRRAERPFWQARYYDFLVHNEEKRVEKLRYMHRNPVVRGLVAKPEDCHPTDEDLSVGTPVAVVQLPALRDRSGRKSRDRVAVERDAAGQPVAGISALPGKGRLRSEASQVPKSEAPGAPIVV